MATAYGNLGDDGNYFAVSGALYADQNPVMGQGAQIAAGFALYQKMNRIAPKVYFVDYPSDGHAGQWVQGPSGNDSAYFPIDGFYVDTNMPEAPPGQVVRGVQLYPKGNRLAVQIWCTEPGGGGGHWVQGSQANDGNYFGPVNDLYADTNLVQLEPWNRVNGVAFWNKKNRIAVCAEV